MGHLAQAPTALSYYSSVLSSADAADATFSPYLRPAYSYAGVEGSASGSFLWLVWTSVGPVWLNYTLCVPEKLVDYNIPVLLAI
jgi:hypothetical protein